MTILQVENLTYQIEGKLLFKDLNFELCANQILQITGSNGAGKTTLLRIFAGLLDTYEGKKEITSEFLFLSHALGIKLSLTPYENLKWNSVNDFSNDAIEKALIKLNLKNQMHLPSQYLSAGQQQRVKLARLLLNHKKLWLLDEPFTALDKEGCELIKNMIEEHARNNGAVIFTSHQTLAFSQPLNKLHLGS